MSSRLFTLYRPTPLLFSSLFKSLPISKSLTLSLPSWPLTRRYKSAFPHQRQGQVFLKDQPSSGQSESGISISSTIVASILLAILVAVSTRNSSPLPHNKAANVTLDNEFPYAYAMSPPTDLPGRIHNLTADQQAKLRELWTLNARLFGFITTAAAATSSSTSSGPSEQVPPAPNPASTPAPHAPETSNQPEPTRSRFSLWRGSSSSAAAPATGGAKSLALASAFAADVTDELVGAGSAGNDKFGQSEQFKKAMSTSTPDQLREAFWAMVKHDHPDGLLLRFLRARKWDVHAAAVMAISALHWRITDGKVDSEIMLLGEGGMLERAEKGEGQDQKVAKDFMGQLRLGKSFMRGADKEGRPLSYIRVRKHKVGEFCNESLERYTIYTIETARMMLKPPIDTGTILFDMTSFGLKNMDNPPVLFMIKCFEANYPESLGKIIIHKAPWIFQGIWKMIRGWLDPVVAGKVVFTNNVKDLEVYIDSTQILKECDGQDEWEYEYIEPVTGENDKIQNIEEKQKLLDERNVLSKQYEESVREWVLADKDDTKKWAELQENRNSIANSLKDNYWKLDPYIRARSLFDRNGELKKHNPDVPETS